MCGTLIFLGPPLPSIQVFLYKKKSIQVFHDVKAYILHAWTGMHMTFDLSSESFGKSYAHDIYFPSCL